jgi:uncharacterized protein
VHVSELYIYPIKSARGIAVPSAQLEARGLEHDRRWMLIDDEAVFISQRDEHRLALVDVAVTTDGLVLSAPDMEMLHVPFYSGGAVMKCRVWSDEVDAVLVSRDAREWFSTFLQRSCSLVYMPDDSRRIVDRNYVADERIVGFADGFPLLLIGQGSLNLLNEKLAERGEAAVPMLRFRPNIVVAETQPHEEDDWGTIQIGSVEADVVKPCARCVITTIDIETGSASKEPLRTLASYRKRGSHVYFGQNVVHRSNGKIVVGDPVHHAS